MFDNKIFQILLLARVDYNINKQMAAYLGITFEQHLIGNSCIQQHSQLNHVVKFSNNDKQTMFTFDQIFQYSSFWKDHEAYAFLSKQMEKLYVEGISTHQCILTYGKESCLMFGQNGIFNKTVKLLFKKIKKQQINNNQFFLSVFQIKRNTVTDLLLGQKPLNPQLKQLKVKQITLKHGNILEDIQRSVKLFKKGQQNERKVHNIVSLTIKGKSSKMVLNFVELDQNQINQEGVMKIKQQLRHLNQKTKKPYSEGQHPLCSLIRENSQAGLIIYVSSKNNVQTQRTLWYFQNIKKQLQPYLIDLNNTQIKFLGPISLKGNKKINIGSSDIQISQELNRYTLILNKSSTRVFVNGQKIKQNKQLRNEDRIFIEPNIFLKFKVPKSPKQSQQTNKVQYVEHYAVENANILIQIKAEKQQIQKQMEQYKQKLKTSQISKQQKTDRIQELSKQILHQKKECQDYAIRCNVLQTNLNESDKKLKESEETFQSKLNESDKKLKESEETFQSKLNESESKIIQLQRLLKQTQIKWAKERQIKNKLFHIIQEQKDKAFALFQQN